MSPDPVLVAALVLLVIVALLLVLMRVRRRRRVQAAGADVVPASQTAHTTRMRGLPKGALIGVAPPEIKGMEYMLNRPVVAIGRSERGNLIRTDDRSVSRHHARIYVRDDDFIFRDLNSPNYNPSAINGSVVDGEHVLSPGDRIEMGETVFEFVRFQR